MISSSVSSGTSVSSVSVSSVSETSGTVVTGSVAEVNTAVPKSETAVNDTLISVIILVSGNAASLKTVSEGISSTVSSVLLLTAVEIQLPAKITNKAAAVILIILLLSVIFTAFRFYFAVCVRM